MKTNQALIETLIKGFAYTHAHAWERYIPTLELSWHIIGTQESEGLGGYKEDFSYIYNILSLFKRSELKIVTERWRGSEDSKYNLLFQKFQMEKGKRFDGDLRKPRWKPPNIFIMTNF